MITFAQYFCICLLSGPGLLLLINWIRRREPDAGMRHVAGQALLLLAQPFIAAALLVRDAVWVKDDDGRILAGNITEVRLKLPHLSDLEAAGSLAQEFSVLEAYDPKSDACRQDPDAYRYVYATRQPGEDYDRFCSTQQARSHA